MTKIQHLQFLALMIPTFVILAAAAVSLADLSRPVDPQRYQVVAAGSANVLDSIWDDRPAQ